MEKRIHNPRYESLKREEVTALQFERLTQLMEKTWTQNEFYRDRWRKAGVSPEMITSLDEFAARVPTVEKQDFIADQEADPPFGRRHAHALSLHVPLVVSNTSGTSGQGVEIHAQTRADFRETEEVYAFGLCWSGLRPGDGLFLTLPITVMPGGRCEYHGAVAFGLTVYAVGNYDAAKKLELLNRFRPVALFGTTSYFGHLAAVSERKPPSPGMRVLLTGGEGAGLAWLERLEDAWQAKVYDRYGSTQAGNDHMFSCEYGIGSRERPGMLHNIDPYVLAEVVDPNTGRHVKDGEEGEIVVTSLYHLDTPLIRCRMRDRAVWHEPAYCPCGRPFSGVEVTSIGRLDDMKKVKGVNIWPQAVDDLLFAQKQIDEYQVVLTSDAQEADVATIKVMPKQRLPAEEAGRFSEHLVDSLRERVGIRFAVEIVAPGTLSRSEYKARRWIDKRLHVQS
ncbi:MAG: phenylacetate--CoA ligase family protein [Acidiferrobacterales bacterium]